MCDVYFDDCEPVSVWREKDTKARKQYWCDCCSRSIAIGEQYVRHFSVADGNGFDEKLCLECKADRKIFAKEHDGAMFCPSAFYEYLVNCVDPHDPESVEMWQPMIDAMRDRSSRVVNERKGDE